MQTDIFLTDGFKSDCARFIKECEAKRKEILDAGKDTADDCRIPTIDDIVSDIMYEGFDEDGEYYNYWGVTDNYDSDVPFGCRVKEFYVDMIDDIVHVIYIDAY